MLVQTWSEVVLQSLYSLFQGFISYLPVLLGALVIFVIGWIVALALGRVVARVLEMLQVNQVLDDLSVMKAAHAAGVKIEFSSLVGAVVKWFFIIAFFLAAVDILGLKALANFLQEVLLYIPNIFVAALILLVAALVADFLEKLVRTGLQATEMGSVRLASVVVRWSVWVFGALAAVSQLGVASNIIDMLITGFVAMLAIAGGLAFGLGGQGAAKDILEDVKKDLR